MKLLRWLRDDCCFCCETLQLLLWNFCGDCVTTYDTMFCCETLQLLLWNFFTDCLTTYMNTTLVFALKLCSFFCETFAVIAWRYTTLAFAVKLCGFCCETFATMKNVAKKMLQFDVELMSTSKKGFLVNFNSKRLWLAKNWCTQLLAGKLEKLSLSWLALSTFCYFKLCWLVNRHRYGWLGF